jgi:hypothetical protein
LSGFHTQQKENTMLSNNSDNQSNQPQASPSKAGEADPVPFLNPGDPIEVAAQGSGTINDPGGTDKKPPAGYQSESSLA